MTSPSPSSPISLLSPRTATLVGVNALGMLAIVSVALVSAVFPGEEAYRFLESTVPFGCLFKLATHIPCFFCGMTRSFVAIAHGDLALSLRYHWLGIPLYLGILAFSGLSLFSPGKAMALLDALRRPLVWGLGVAVLLGVWVVKLGQNPVYW